jgi:hypothetical protein|nr:MAG TPA: protein of unknown function (DUF4393) [Caudoviricetes sp.]
MPEGLDQLAKGIGKAIETVPELYEDAFQPTVQETGKFFARVPRAINAAFSGLDKWILNREYSIEETKKLLAQKLENIDPEKIVEPEPYVAIPAIQSISYAMNSDELRNLYANLLAKSMISDTKDSVHPSFVEIIKQMSPKDAKVFNLIFIEDLRPLIDLQIKSSSGGWQPIQYHCSWITEFSIKQVATSIDNLIRLGLIEVPYGETYTAKKIYDKVKCNPLFKDLELQSRAILHEEETINHEERYIKTTDLSTLFYNICVLNP